MQWTHTTPMQFFFCGYVKVQFLCTEFVNVNKVRARATDAAVSVTPLIPERSLARSRVYLNLLRAASGVNIQTVRVVRSETENCF
jgi:hypothetical protein